MLKNVKIPEILELHLGFQSCDWFYVLYGFYSFWHAGYLSYESYQLLILLMPRLGNSNGNTNDNVIKYVDIEALKDYQ